MIILLYFFYFCFPILSTPIILLALFYFRKKYRVLIPLLCLNVSIIGYNYRPILSNDLYRYFTLLDSMRSGGLNFVIEQSEYKSSFLINFIFYFVSITKENSLLPALIGFVFYFIILYIIFDYANSKNISTSSLVFATLFALLVIPMIDVLSGIRNAFAFSVVALALYRDLVKKNLNVFTYLLYLGALFSHSSIIVLLIFRFIVPFYKGHLKKILISIAIFLWPLYVSLIGFIFSLLPQSNLVSVIQVKIGDYTGTQKGGIDWSQDILIYRIIILLIIILLIKFIKNKLPLRSALIEYSSFVQLLVIFTCGCLPFLYVHIIFRFTFIIFILGTIIILESLKHLKVNTRVFVKYILILIISSGGYYQYLTINKIDYGGLAILVKNIIQSFIK